MHKTIVMLALLMVGVLAVAAELLTPRAFTQEYFKAAQVMLPSVQLTIKADLELAAKAPSGMEATVYLDNAYSAYRSDPASKTQIIERYLGSLSVLNKSEDHIDRSRIVPVVKDRGWLAEMTRATQSRGATQTPEFYSEDYNSDLVILYAEDTPQSIRYLSDKSFEELKLQRSELRPLALANLKLLLPKIDVQATSPIQMVVADGNYEASLLLFDSLWTGDRIKVDGEIVVAIPARDLLLVTGSNNKAGIAELRQIAKQFGYQANYRLTDKLFVYRSGRFVSFD